MFYVINAGNAHHICMTTCRMLFHRAGEYIRWPSQYSLEETASKFEFPGTIGKSSFVGNLSLN